MNVYRTTCYQLHNPGTVEWVRYGITRIRYAAAKGATWHSGSRRVTLECAEIPEDAWTLIEDSEESNAGPSA